MRKRSNFKIVSLFVTIILISVLLGFLIGRISSGAAPLGFGYPKCPRWQCTIFSNTTGRMTSTVFTGCWHTPPYPTCVKVGYCSYCE